MNVQLPTAAQPPVSGLSDVEWLDHLREVLQAALESLNRGDPEVLITSSWQIALQLQQSAAPSFEWARMPISSEAQRRRRELLGELREQSAFCRAMLRRWRRSILLRKQLLALEGEPAFYTEAVGGEAPLR